MPIVTFKITIHSLVPNLALSQPIIKLAFEQAQTCISLPPLSPQHTQIGLGKQFSFSSEQTLSRLLEKYVLVVELFDYAVRRHLPLGFAFLEVKGNSARDSFWIRDVDYKEQAVFVDMSLQAEQKIQPIPKNQDRQVQGTRFDQTVKAEKTLPKKSKNQNKANTKPNADTKSDFWAQFGYHGQQEHSSPPQHETMPVLKYQAPKQPHQQKPLDESSSKSSKKSIIMNIPVAPKKRPPKPAPIFLPHRRAQQVRKEVAATQIDWGFGKGTFIPMIKDGKMVMMPLQIGDYPAQAMMPVPRRTAQEKEKTYSNLNESYSREQFEEYQSESFRKRSTGSFHKSSELIESKYDEDFQSYSRSMLGSRDIPAESIAEQESIA